MIQKIVFLAQKGQRAPRRGESQKRQVPSPNSRARRGNPALTASITPGPAPADDTNSFPTFAPTTNGREGYKRALAKNAVLA